MGWFYRHLLRPALFTQNPEQIHNRTMQALAWAGRRKAVGDVVESFLGAPELPIEVFGLRFPNPVGLAAGMDKHAEALPAWAALGFGFTELGAVTWHAQPGNPAPRVFRAISDEAIINRMGFNNPGAEAVAQTLTEWRQAGRWPNHPVGMNLGKSKITPLDRAAEDYANSLRVLLPHLDFFVVNVSSPNTPNLRELQDKAALDEILAALQEVQSSEWQAEAAPHATRNTQHSSPTRLPKPILVKISPDISFEAMDQILELVEPRQLAGIIATNTTITRPETSEPKLQRVYSESGGLSGRPLRQRSTEVIRQLYRRTSGKLPIIGVGGIFDAQDAWEKLAAGASLLQVYTGLVYEGPRMARTIVTGLRQRLKRQGMANLKQAIGSGNG
ncbi:MAG TPA: quinone-dependent dihydroorotate dehydrogenase [Candidatus Acidoferrum sp.]|jgi:dihydroorotate dehydrogenase|nr:quinone-dependent dihydroorotate dehydrogenase [Candidatus Acidoferrum sp.]